MKNRFSRIASAIATATAKPFLLLTAAVLLFACTFVSCGGKTITCGWDESAEPTDYVCLTVRYVNSDKETVTGDIVIKLRGDVAPITVENFKELVASDFYNNLTFHRVYSGFMMQGGDPKGNGTGGSEHNIKGEFSSNGVENTLSHKRGVVSMARSNDPDSASSQFFICHADSTFLDGNYAAFGEVVFGMETVDGIAGTEVVSNGSELSKPVTAPVIVKAYFVIAPDGI